MSKIAIIDIGSASTKISIFKNVYSKSVRQILSRTENIRLISQNNIIDDNSIEELLNILCDFCDFAKIKHCKYVKIYGTQAIRQAMNQSDICEKIFQKVGESVIVLTGEQEANIIAHGIQKVEALKRFISFDIGAGSVEFNSVNNDDIKSISLPIGMSNCVNWADFDAELPIQQDKIEKISSHINNYLKSIPFDCTFSQECPLIATGGALVIAKSLFNITTNVLTVQQLDELFQKLSSMSFSERISAGVPQVKADIFPIGLLIAINVCNFFASNSLKLSCANLRYGAAIV